MSERPFCKFQGLRPQLDRRGRSDVEPLRLAKLLPHFVPPRVIEAAIRQKHEELIRPFPDFELQEDLAQLRRIAGVSLSRGQSGRIGKDSTDDDRHTRVKELQAYRDPEATGPVASIDLALDRKAWFGPLRP